MASLPALATVCVVWTVGFPQAAQSKNLVVSSLLIPPFLSAKHYLRDGIKTTRYEGYVKDLMDEIVKITGTPYTFSVRRDTIFGHSLGNGSWSGLIGDVMEGRADMAVGPLTETSERSKVVDFSTPFMNFGPVVVLKRPHDPIMTLKERLQRLFSPLSQTIWMISGVAWLVTSALLYFICHVNPYEWRRLAKDRHATVREGESFSCFNTFWFTASNALFQGYTRSPRSLGGRIVVTFWWIYVLIFIIMYIASMTNYLRMGPMQDASQYYTSIQGIEDLGRQSEINYGVLREGATEQYLVSAKIQTVKKVWARIKQHKSYMANLDKAIAKVRSSRKPFALITESAMARYFTRQSPCDIYMVGDFITIGSYSLAFPANSSLVKSVDIALLTLRERGVLKEMDDRWFSGECTDYVVESNNYRAQMPRFYEVDLGSFSGALIILIVGLIIGSLATGIEVLIYKFTEKGAKKKDGSGHSPIASAAAEKDQTASKKEPQEMTKV